MVNFSCNFSVWNQVKEVVNHFQVMKMFQMDFSDRQTNNQCYPKTTVPLTEIWSHIQHMLAQDVLGHLARSLNTWLSRWKWIALYLISCLVMCTNQNLKFEPLILVSKQLLQSTGITQCQKIFHYLWENWQTELLTKVPCLPFPPGFRDLKHLRCML